MATPEYFAVFGKRMLKAGVRGVGGCCGTTSEHLEVLSGPVRMLSAGKSIEEVSFFSFFFFFSFFSSFFFFGRIFFLSFLTFFFLFLF
jgi:hypothetical protein